jgi:hypothetical protein
VNCSVKLTDELLVARIVTSIRPDFCSRFDNKCRRNPI